MRNHDDIRVVSGVWWRPFGAITSLVVLLATCQSGARNVPLQVDGALGSDARENLTLPSTVRSPIVIPPHRRVVVAEDTEVVPGGRVELAAGDVVAFSEGKGLFIRGGELVVRGTAVEPVFFTSAVSKPRVGSWTGLVFDWAPPPGDAAPHPSSLIEHAVVEYGGAPWKGRGGIEGAGGISLVGYVTSRKHPMKAGELSVRNVELRDNANRGLDARTDATVRLSELRFGQNSGVSARIDLEFADQLGGAPTEAVELVGILRRSVTLPRLAKPYVATESLSIASFPGTPEAILTISPGATVAFRRGKGLSFGGHLAGKLVAHGVTFTSAESPPRAGDWRGMTFMAPGSADLMDDVFEYGGEDGFPVVSVGRVSQANVKIQRTVFRNNAGPGIGGGSSCAVWSRPSFGNASEGQPLCVSGRR